MKSQLSTILGGGGDMSYSKEAKMKDLPTLPLMSFAFSSTTKWFI